MIRNKLLYTYILTLQCKMQDKRKQNIVRRQKETKIDLSVSPFYFENATNSYKICTQYLNKTTRNKSYQCGKPRALRGTNDAAVARGE